MNLVDIKTKNGAINKRSIIASMNNDTIEYVKTQREIFDYSETARKRKLKSEDLGEKYFLKSYQESKKLHS